MASQQYQTYEHDDRWTDVDHYALEHLDKNNPYGDALKYAIELAQKEGLPKIEVSALQGKLLALQCQLANAKHVLEVGTLGGYSSIWLASADPEIHVTTIEVDAHHKDVAEKVHKHAGLSDRIEVLLGPGVEVLPKIRSEVESGRRPKFDLVFIDADKPNNLAYFNEAAAISRSRALIIIDNVVRKGQLASADAAKTDPKVQGSREVVEAVGKDTRVLGSTLLQTVGEKNYDGFLLCTVR